MAEVSINQEFFPIPPSGILTDILPFLHIESADGIAVAVNDHVIPRNEWETYSLRDKDRIFVIRATQGG
jgi:sulfur carrier protein